MHRLLFASNQLDRSGRPARHANGAGGLADFELLATPDVTPETDSVLEDRLAQALALRVLQLLEPVLEQLARGRTADVLLDAATLGRQLGVSRQFVYDHADELGVLRLGSGRRPRLRFDLETAKRACQRIAHRDSATDRPSTQPASRRRPGAATELLPVWGRPA